MCVCTHVYIYISTCIYTCIYLCMYISISLSLCKSIYPSIPSSIHLHMSLLVYRSLGMILPEDTREELRYLPVYNEITMDGTTINE